MKEAKAKLNNYRQSPRKVRLIADAIRGKSIMEAKNSLNFLIKRASAPIGKLLNSAVANAKNLGMDADSLKIKSIMVDGGDILYRRMPVAHGAAHPIRKRTSHITVVLAEGDKAKTKKQRTKTSKA